jgi:hypothetical protein
MVAKVAMKSFKLDMAVDMGKRPSKNTETEDQFCITLYIVKCQRLLGQRVYEDV